LIYHKRKSEEDPEDRTWKSLSPIDSISLPL